MKKKKIEKGVHQIISQHYSPAQPSPFWAAGERILARGDFRQPQTFPVYSTHHRILEGRRRRRQVALGRAVFAELCSRTPGKGSIRFGLLVGCLEGVVVVMLLVLAPFCFAFI